MSGFEPTTQWSEAQHATAGLRRMLMSNFDVFSLLAQVFIVSVDRAYKEGSTKKYWKFSMAQFLWYDCTFKKQYTVPVTLTFDLWRTIFDVNWVQTYKYPVYLFQIDISSNSREIKYQNVGTIYVYDIVTDRQTHTQTDTQYLTTPSGGEVIRQPVLWGVWGSL